MDETPTSAEDTLVTLATVATASIDESKRGPGFSLVENVLVCKAFIVASEDPIVGRSQKGKVFKTKMFKTYSTMIENQTTYDRTMMSQASGTTRQAYSGQFVGTGHYPVRKENGIYERFIKKIAPEVCKFMGVLDTTPKDSGTNDDDHYQNCLTIFRQRYGHAFDFEACYTYLRDKVKFSLFRQRLDEEEKDKGKENVRPVGNKAAKKAKADALMIKQALDGLKKEEKETNSTSDLSIASVSGGSAVGIQDFFYKSASDLIIKTGEALSTYVESQKLAQESQKLAQDHSNEKEILNMMSTPEKKEILEEKKKLYIAELRAKRRKVEMAFNLASDD
jgi:hypothetical protein